MRATGRMTQAAEWRLTCVRGVLSVNCHWKPSLMIWFIWEQIARFGRLPEPLTL